MVTIEIDPVGGAGEGVPEPAMELGVLSEGFFDEADADDDGFVSKGEFVAYCHRRKGTSPSEDDWKAFYAADANGDGRISKDEFEHYVDSQWAAGGGGGLSIDTVNVAAAGPVYPEPAMELGVLEDGFFDAADADNDGFVTKAEFVSYRRKQCGEPPSLDDWKKYYAADKNGDGRISKEEFEDFCAAQWSDTRTQHEPGDRVAVHSLVAAPEHNRKQGVVVDFRSDIGRYAVRLDDGSAVSIRPSNLAPAEDDGADGSAPRAEARGAAQLDRQRDARVQAQARAQLAKSRTQKKAEALAAAKARLAAQSGALAQEADAAAARLGVGDELRHARASISQLNPHRSGGPEESSARQWTEAEVLHLEAEVEGLRNRILYERPVDEAKEAARIEELLTMALGPRDRTFGAAARQGSSGGGGRVGLSESWLASRNLSSQDAAAESQLSAVRDEIAQLRAELSL